MNATVDIGVYASVLVFKTNITTHQEVEKVKSVLRLEKNIIKWNIDLEDIDNVLRIECTQLHPSAVIKRVRSAGFECEELPD